MLRTTICLLFFATPVMAQDKAELCQVSSDIAGAAVAERQDGQAANSAVTAIAANLPDEQSAYEAAVQPIVEWVYTLPEEQLGDEVASSYKTACLEQ
ncbi:DNA primase [Roseovarius sp. 2305UL8-3]|uniref:DNA primase n=1 Tax=Roseovarius conchicola TaxID=3121636 RepID=UPI003526E99E